jgi:tetratricopeptide (TPR) repeat protein
MPSWDELDRYVNEYLKKEPSDTGGVRDLMGSHLLDGQKLWSQGKLHEAIAEYEKEHNRPIKKAVDAEILQNSYWYVGRAYRQLGDLEKALQAYRKAHELLQKHGVGSGTHAALAEIYIEQGRFDDAIAICQDALPAYQHKYEQMLLEKATALKKSQSDNHT